MEKYYCNRDYVDKVKILVRIMTMPLLKLGHIAEMFPNRPHPETIRRVEQKLLEKRVF